jgi:hypothetical protein
MNLTINLTVEEINYILATLAQRPFGEVVNLVNNIKAQAEPQLPPPAPVEQAA